ncbi:MAG: DNA topoisomerase IB [Dasosvirus sp.]|uniref:DNA topoisomerase 1 n=1 Tax=Dasosvirus sp. TaxID=2487764 RepID=A0A3G4ZU94_9VIRU|nr:MAG: DNA topoisomerase IB [Dasosvirus sp.]
MDSYLNQINNLDPDPLCEAINILTGGTMIDPDYYIGIHKTQSKNTHSKNATPLDSGVCPEHINLNNTELSDRPDHCSPTILGSPTIPVTIGGSGSSIKKWNTLEHHGVMFHPEYQPHNIPIKYEQREVQLNPEEEEYITYYLQPRYDKYRNDKFKKNFFNDWKKLLQSSNKNIIKDFNLCNFDRIREHIVVESERTKEQNKNKSKEQREEEKANKDQEKEKYSFAIVDGAKQTIDNYIVEPPSIFIGRGAHPLSGSIKKRLYPEDITINIGPNAQIPVPSIDGVKRKWGNVITDHTLEWIASWQNNVTHKYNYARFGRKSSFKMKSDESKYDLARKLKKKIKKIRIINEKNMKSPDLETRQLATALYLIDKLALRIGNEKKTDEADTVGASTLKIKNVSLLDNNAIKLDFLGKDSIRYVNKFVVPESVHKNIKEFYQNKSNNDELFDKITSDLLNKYIKSFMKKLTSKVFRTYNASYLMQIELKKINNRYADYKKDLTDKEKSDKVLKLLHDYEMANLKVAKLCNHQKIATNVSSKQLEKTQERVKELQKKINKLKKEKKKKIDNNKNTTAINTRIGKLQEKLKLLKSKKSIQAESKTLSTGTSKINYIDPRITIAFLKHNGIIDSIDKFFNKSQQKQFQWAMNVTEDFKF